MTALLTIVAAILVFGIVVLVHEWGHFRAARRCGVRVEEFAIGFGPAIWKRTGKDGTLYSIRLLPLGGYNMMAGYIDPDNLEEDESGRIRVRPDAESQPPIKKPRGAPVLPDAIDGKTYPEATAGQRFFIIASGALMNFVLGFVLLVILVCMQDAITSKIIYGFSDGALSQQTGLQAGDEIVAVNGHYCFTANDIVYELQRTENYTADFTVMRSGEITQVPGVQFATRTDENGNTTMVLDFTVYGIAKTPKTVVRAAFNNFMYYARVILRSFVDLATGRVGVTELSGPVGIVSAIGTAVSYGLADVLSLAALITVNLGIFNLLPIPGLDGCKLIFIAIEGVSGHAVPEKVQGAINAAGMILLLLLMVFVTFQDVNRFL